MSKDVDYKLIDSLATATFTHANVVRLAKKLLRLNEMKFLVTTNIVIHHCGPTVNTKTHSFFRLLTRYQPSLSHKITKRIADALSSDKAMNLGIPGNRYFRMSGHKMSVREFHRRFFRDANPARALCSAKYGTLTLEQMLTHDEVIVRKYALEKLYHV